MANDVTTSGTPERVALDLMQAIASKEFDNAKVDQKSREYWLKLYRQCYLATRGATLTDMLRRD